jgi:GcrA cell cycle regulator
MGNNKTEGRCTRTAVTVAHAADLYMSTPHKKVDTHKTLVDLEHHDCRWPIGEPRSADFHFCGQPQAPGRPYCAHHWGMAFQPSKPRHAPQPRPQVPALPLLAPAKAA